MTDLFAGARNFAIVGGQRTPGPTCELTGAALTRQWDKQRPSGSSGGRLIFKGRDFSEFSMKLTMATSEDWAAWDEFKPVLEQPPRLGSDGKRVVQGIDFSHPVTDVVGIRAVVLGQIMAPVQGETGEWTIEVKFTEYRDPEPSQARARGARNEDADDPVANEIRALEAQGNALAARVDQLQAAP